MQKVELPNGAEFSFYTPKELKAHLDEYVIGQEDAKRTLSVAVYNHYKRLFLKESNADIKVDKSNIILQGMTGSGKTYSIKKIAEYMGLPYYIADATSLTQAGYVGDDVEAILSGLIRAANGDVELAQMGIIVLDECDKLAKKGANVHISRDVVGEGVQQALLKIVEGSTVGVPPAEGRKHPEQQLIYMDTSNILFIGVGAFSGIEDIVKKRMTSQSVGFNAVVTKSDEEEITNPYEYVSQEDLRTYGMIPEFIGRFPVLTHVNPLTEDDLIHIMSKPKNSILKQYTALFAVDGIKLSFEEDALKLIAKVAIKLKTGARALRSIIEEVMKDFVFEYSDSNKKKLVITESIVRTSLSKRYKNLLD